MEAGNSIYMITEVKVYCTLKKINLQKVQRYFFAQITVHQVTVEHIL